MFNRCQHSLHPPLHNFSSYLFDDSPLYELLVKSESQRQPKIGKQNTQDPAGSHNKGKVKLEADASGLGAHLRHDKGSVLAGSV